MRTIFLVAGPSGSGKSRLALETGVPHLSLDDFYRDGDEPGLPRALGIVDWDDVASWNLASAVEALRTAVREDAMDLPVYAIAANARVGTRRLDLTGANAVVAEGIFAVEALAALRGAGVPVVPLWLDRPRTLVAVLRLVRDVREHRKPVPLLLRRGVALWQAEPALRRRALAAGFVAYSMRRARAVVRAHS